MRNTLIRTTAAASVLALTGAFAQAATFSLTLFDNNGTVVGGGTVSTPLATIPASGTPATDFSISAPFPSVSSPLTVFTDESDLWLLKLSATEDASQPVMLEGQLYTGPLTGDSNPMAWFFGPVPLGLPLDSACMIARHRMA